MKNALSWMLWSAFTLSLLLTTRNPLYLLIMAIILLILGHSIAEKKAQTFWLRGNLRFLFTMLAISTVINTLFSHTGMTVIFSLPEN